MSIPILKAPAPGPAKACFLAAALLCGPGFEAKAQTAAAPDTLRADLPPMVRLVQEAEFLAGRGQLKPAISRYEEAVELGAGSAEVLNRLGTLYLADGKVPESIAAFKRSMVERPGQLQVYSALSEAFLAAGRLDSAIAVMEEARRLAPEVSVIESALGFLYRQATGPGPRHISIPPCFSTTAIRKRTAISDSTTPGSTRWRGRSPTTKP